MVVDSSAIVAMLLAEPEHEEFFRLVGEAAEPATSVASLLECSIVMHRRAGLQGLAALDELIEDAGIRCVPVDVQQVLTARRAWVRYGRGNSPAGLNFGDCFSYALARTMDRPLLFKGGDFTRTDARVAG